MTNAVVPLGTISLVAPTENGAQALQVYRLRKSLAAVRFEPSGKGRIVFLSQGAELRVVGSSRLSECFEVMCENQLYNIFKADLLGPESLPVRNGRVSPARTRALKACA